MTRTLLLTGLRDLVRRPLHTGLMVLGVALGVAVVIAIDLANTSAKRGFRRSTEAVTALLERVTREKGRSLVLVTHNEAVAAMADRVFAIEDGHLVPLAAGARLSA